MTSKTAATLSLPLLLLSACCSTPGPVITRQTPCLVEPPPAWREVASEADAEGRVTIQPGDVAVLSSNLRALTGWSREAWLRCGGP